MDYAWQIGWLVLFGIGFGLAATVPPGPINAQIARRTLKFGFLPGLAFGVGSIFVENALAMLACMGYGEKIDEHPLLLNVMLFVGFVVLAVVGTFAVASGYRAWQDPAASRHAIDTAAELEPDPLRATPGINRTKIISMPRSFFAGAGMGVISPYTIVFWMVGLPAVAQSLFARYHHVWPLLVGILVGTSAWIGGYTSMIAWLKRYRSTGMWADLVGGVMLLVFAALALLKLASMVLHPSSSGGGVDFSAP